MKGYKPEDNFVIVIGIFTLLGIWPASIKLPTLRFIYNIFGCCFHVIYYVALLPTEIISIFLNRNNLLKLIDCSFFTITNFVYGIKLLNVILKRRKIEELFHRLKSPLFTPTNFKHLKIMQKCANIAKLNCTVYITMCWLCSGWWVIFPMIGEKQEDILLFEAWYPFNVTIRPYYTYTYAFQSAILFVTSAINSMMDMLVTSFFITMMGQIDMLKIDFRELTHIISENVNRKQNSHDVIEQKIIMEEFFSPNNTNVSFSSDKYCAIKLYKMRIAFYVARHKAILTFIQDVLEIFETNIMAQLCGSCIVICLTSFEMSMMDPSGSQFYVVVQYQLCMLLQIFLYTWRGNGISVKISELMDAVYECSWVSVPDKDFRKLLCIIMSRLQVPVTIKVWNLFFLSINTFINVIKSSYSFYILLKQLQMKND